MNTHSFTCPLCAQLVEAPGNSTGQMVVCPNCQRGFVAARGKPARALWIVMAASAAVMFIALHLIRLSVSDEFVGLLSIVCVVLFALAIANLLWLSRARLAGRGGLALLMTGIFILAVCWIGGSMAGLIAGGFIAVIGSVLWLKK